MIGNLQLTNSIRDAIDFQVSPIPIHESLMEFEEVESSSQFALIVEKDSVFQRLLDENYMQKYPNSILITVSIVN